MFTVSSTTDFVIKNHESRFNISLFNLSLTHWATVKLPQVGVIVGKLLALPEKHPPIGELRSGKIMFAQV